MNQAVNATSRYDFEASNTNSAKVELFNEYKTYKKLLFGIDTKLSYGDRKYLDGYMDAINEVSTFLGKEMFVMVNNDGLLDSVNKLDKQIGDTNNKINDIDKKMVEIETLVKAISSNIEKNHQDISSKLDGLHKNVSENYIETKDVIFDIDKKTTVLETLVDTGNKNILDKLDKLDNISSDIIAINNRLILIETKDKDKETSKDRHLRQLLYPFIISIAGGTTMAIVTRILSKLFP